jgi:hypothetical protein
MKSFLQRHSSEILGVLSGFDRLRFRGTFRQLAYPEGMMAMLTRVNVLLKDFGQLVNQTTGRLRAAVQQVAAQTGRSVQYLQSPRIDKEQWVERIFQRHGMGPGGIIAILSAVERCQSFEVYRNRQRQMLQLRSAVRQCLHYYVYLQDSMFGRVHVRMQTWFPFNVHVVMNGREWLSRQMDAAGIDYRRHDNCFTRVGDFARAQQLLDHQVRIDWGKHLDRLLKRANPALPTLLAPEPMAPYWSLEQSEWATDVAFGSPAQLRQLYPRLVQHAMRTFDSREVMRFLGRKVPGTEGVHSQFAGEVVSDLAYRPEGMRVKHRVNRNAVKMYDKQGVVLRVETTINEAGDLKAYRAKEGDPNGPKQYRPLRKGIADLARRAQLCATANRRYLEALASADTTAPLQTITDKLCQSVTKNRRRYRALNPFAPSDAELLKAVARGEFLIKGFRNADIRVAILGADPNDPIERRRRANRVSRLFALLRAHGLIKKIPKTHRYLLTAHGRRSIPAILVARETSVDKLNPAA